MLHSLIVIGIVILLRFLTNWLLNWTLKIQLKKFPDQNSSAIPILKKNLNTLWIILGLMAIRYFFDTEDNATIIRRNFKIALYIGVVLSISIASASSVNIWFNLNIKKKIAANEDSTSYKFLRYVGVSSILFIGALFCILAFPSLKGIAQTALGGAGVLAIIAGLAAQEALANIIGGIFIITFKPFRIGDVIEISSAETGVVFDITLRHTIIRNYKNRMIVIPNSVINKEKIVNYDLGDKKSCEYVEVKISYESDIAKAKQTMKDECEKHPLIFDNRSQKEKKENAPIVKTSLISFEDSSVLIRAWVWARNYSDSITIKREALEQIKKRFEEEGIEIPYPHKTITYKQNFS